MRTVRMSVVGAVGSVAVLVVTLVVIAPQRATAQDDPHVGTWVLNVAKSKFSPGPPPKEQTLIWSAVGQGFKISATTTSASGETNTGGGLITFDGKDQPSVNSSWDAVSSKRVDSHTIEMTRKKGGKVVGTATSVVSKDGKTRTVTATGVDAQGRKISNVSVFDKK